MLRLILLSFISCISLNLYANDASIKLSDAKKPIIVNEQNRKFAIILQANPTTGYSWFLKSYDSTLVNPLNEKYYSMNDKLIGSGGYDKWLFEVKSTPKVPKVTEITMIYARPWNMEVAQTVTFKIVIQ